MRSTLSRLLFLALGLTASTFAAAQVPPPPARTAPVNTAPRVERLRAVPTPPVSVVLQEQQQADAIARDAPDVREAARRLRQRGVRPPVAVTALRSHFDKSDDERIRALLAAGYPEDPLVDALVALDRLDARGLNARLIGLARPLETRARQVARLFPGQTFDGLFLILSAPPSAPPQAWDVAAATLALPLDTLLGTGARFHQARQMPLGNGGFHPEPGALASLARRLHPSTPLPQLWGRLLSLGYRAEAVFKEVPARAVAGNGLSLDAMASCVSLRFPGQSPTQNPVVAVRLELDGQVRHEPAQADCYGDFLRALRSEGVARTNAAVIAREATSCFPEGAPACEAARNDVIAAILARAGYPAGDDAVKSR